MVVPIPRQANYSLESQLIDMAELALHLSQDETAQDGQLLNAYSSFLADALAWDIMLETGVSGPSLVLANHPFAKQGHEWHCLPA